MQSLNCISCSACCSSNIGSSSNACELRCDCIITSSLVSLLVNCRK